MIFDYASEEVFTKQLDLVDPGNTCIRGTNEEKMDYYLIIKTVMGKTSFLKFGPVFPDAPILLEDFSVSYKKANYKENTINKEINLFLNDTKKCLVEAKETVEYEAFQAFPNLEDAFNNL